MKKLIYFLVLALVLGVGAWSQANAAEGTVEKWVTQEAMQATAAYWTPARMRAAKPAPMPVPSAEGVGVPDVGPPGPPGAVKSGCPGSQTSALLSDDEFAALDYTGAFAEPAAVGLMGYTYPPPHNTYRIPDYLYGNTSTSINYSPYRTVGKVFFTQNASNYVCSGSSIGGRAVLTAGHCVSDGAGTWNTNTAFVPSYRNNIRPFGTWTAFWLTTFELWFNHEQLGRDVGFFAVTDIGAVKLSAKVGWLGFAWNQGRIHMWNMFGYPQAAPYTGAYLYTTQASYATTDTLRTPGTTGIGFSQTGGCSGGPWIKTFVAGAVGANNYANGVNSYLYLGSPFQIYSPYFDTAVNTMRVTAIAQ